MFNILFSTFAKHTFKKLNFFFLHNVHHRFGHRQVCYLWFLCLIPCCHPFFLVFAVLFVLVFWRFPLVFFVVFVVFFVVVLCFFWCVPLYLLSFDPIAVSWRSKSVSLIRNQAHFKFMCND